MRTELNYHGFTERVHGPMTLQRVTAFLMILGVLVFLLLSVCCDERVQFFFFFFFFFLCTFFFILGSREWWWELGSSVGGRVEEGEGGKSGPNTQ